MMSCNADLETWADEYCVNKASHTFEYKGWRVTIELEPSRVDGMVSGHANLHDPTAFRCRLTLSGRHEDGASAIRALAARSRALIDERQFDE